MPESNPLVVEWRELALVHPYAGNPRNISDAAIAKVAASIEAFGWRQPIVVDDEGVVIAGHTRRLAAERLGLERVPVHVAVGMSEAATRAYRLADNRTGEEATWDQDALRVEIEGLAALDFDLAPLGFEPAELDFGAAHGGSIEDPPANAYAAKFGVIVLCKDEPEQQDVYARLKQQGFELKVVTT